MDRVMLRWIVKAISTLTACVLMGTCPAWAQSPADGDVDWDAQLDALHLFSSDDPSEVRSRLLSIKDNPEASLTPLQLTRVIQLIGNTYVYESDYDSADAYYDIAARRFESLGRMDRLARIYVNRGSVARRRGDRIGALSHYRRALALAESANNDIAELDTLAMIQNNMGVLLDEMGLLELSLENYLSAYEYEKRRFASSGFYEGATINAASNAIRNYAALGRIGKAEALIAEADSLPKGDIPQETYVRLEESKGLVALAAGNYEQAITLFQTAIDFYTRSGGLDDASHGKCYILAAEVRAGSVTNDVISDFERRAQECIDFARKTKRKNDEAEAMIWLSKAYAQSSDHVRAFEMAIDAFDVQSEYGEESYNSAIQVAVSELKSEVNRASVKLAEQEAAIARAAAIEQRRMTIMAIALSLTLVVGLTAVVLMLRKRGKLNRELKQKNVRIEAQADELTDLVDQREILLEELNHRVKNNLQIVAALLGLETDRAILESNEAQKLRDVQARVISLASIHEAIDGKSISNNVQLDDYLQRLTDKLNELYGECCHFDSMQDDDVTVDMQIVAAAGLIVVELVANAYEHAYPEEEEVRRIGIRRRVEDAQYVVDVLDDGVGLPSGFQLEGIASMGLSLVCRLVAQIDAELTFGASERGGALFSLKLPGTLQDENSH
ncbi:MAG: histidine kinase dimerization/phosphoacceptor domain -containing protein [Pseudomonadota bacterium]